MSNQTISGRPRRLTALVALAGMALLGACSMDVDNPAQIQDLDLTTPEAVQALVAGVQGNFDQAMIQPGGGGLVTAGAMLSDELVHVGTWIGLRGLSDGQSHDDWVESQSRWAEPSQARWVAEATITRLGDIFAEDGTNPSTSEEPARVTMYAGHANRALGDHFCEAVIDGGPLQSYDVFYSRAEGHFDNAITLAAAAGADDVLLASYAGRAHVRMQQGDWTGAAADAAMVPTAFVYNMVYSDNSDISNDMYWWGYLRDETSVWGTPFETLGENLSVANGGDPRVQYDIAYTSGGAVRDGGDGRRPFYRQRKFRSYGEEIALHKGTEMRLIQAEAALMGGDFTTATGFINDVRDHYSLANVAPANVDETWTALMTERGIELWLEGKRLGDLRRWATTRSGNIPFSVVREEASGQPSSADPIREVLDTEVYNTQGDLCIQVSKNEKASNKNIT